MSRATIVRIVIVAILSAAAIFSIDRLFLWMESKGWIYWRKRRAMSTGMGNAMLEVHSLLEPDKKHLVEMKKEVKRQTIGKADGKDPGK